MQVRTEIRFGGLRNTMLYQLTWKILPGLRGLSCSVFRAVPTAAPDTERGVAVDCATAAEAAALTAEFDRVFAPQRFSNNAAAFESVKTFVLDWAAKKKLVPGK